MKVLGRTFIECCVDLNSVEIAENLKELKEEFFPEQKPIVFDLFTGSGNLLYHIAEQIDAEMAFGFENDPQVFDCTIHNFSILGGTKCKFLLGDYSSLLEQTKAEVL